MWQFCCLYSLGYFVKSATYWFYRQSDEKSVAAMFSLCELDIESVGTCMILLLLFRAVTFILCHLLVPVLYLCACQLSSCLTLSLSMTPFSSPLSWTQICSTCSASCSSPGSRPSVSLDLACSSRSEPDWGEGRDKATRHIRIRTAAFLLEENLQTSVSEQIRL